MINSTPIFGRVHAALDAACRECTDHAYAMWARRWRDGQDRDVEACRAAVARGHLAGPRCAAAALAAFYLAEAEAAAAAALGAQPPPLANTNKKG